jgi:quercetin dioxygenase-like cupin family protein
MVEETISRRGTMVVRRLILEPGEATPWHVDPFYRLTVIIRGDALVIEHREGRDTARIDVAPGMSDWDPPTDVVHRGVNIGQHTYEEVAVFFLDRADATPQPRVD